MMREPPIAEIASKIVEAFHPRAPFTLPAQNGGDAKKALRRRLRRASCYMVPKTGFEPARGMTLTRPST